MMKETMRERITEEMNRFTTFKKQTVTKAAREQELRDFQNEKVVRVLGEEYRDNYRLHIKDVYDQLERKNTELGGVANELLEEYRMECIQFGKLIRAEICDNFGEKLVVQKLRLINGSKRIIKNIQLGNELGTAELDVLVFTKKAVFIIEVKNTEYPIEISEGGTYYVLNDQRYYNGNLREKMEFRETLLRETLAETMDAKNLKIVKLVVFTNNVEMQNDCEELLNCNLEQLPSIISDFSGDDLYTDYEISYMAETMKYVKNTHEYAVGMDMQKFKEDFATLLVTLEAAEKAKREAVSEKKIYKLFRWFGSFMPAA